MPSNTAFCFCVRDCARIDPGNTFRLVVKVCKYVADGEYRLVEMAEQEHELWLDRSEQYSLAKFVDEMASKIIWRPSQTLAVWVVDTDSDSKWKIRRDDHFHRLIKDRWNEMIVVLVVEVVSKHDHTPNASSGVRCASSVTSAQGSVGAGNAQGSGATTNAQGSAAPDNAQGSGIPGNVEGSGDTCSPPPPSVSDEPAALVDWAELTILQEPNEDGEAKQATDEDKVYEAMSFKATDETAKEAARESVHILIRSGGPDLHDVG
jgi:hypothetical protein